MLTVATCYWDALPDTPPNSRCFTPEWVDRLARNVRRHLTRPHRFIVFVDRVRHFTEAVQQLKLSRQPAGFHSMIEPFRIEGPLIVMGLDTVIVGNIDHMADWCEKPGTIGLPTDPYEHERTINGVALVPPGNRRIYDAWRGENDMVWLRNFPARRIDDEFPGQVVSLKFDDVRRKGLQNARIVYMHGRPKQHELTHLDWVRENWR